MPPRKSNVSVVTNGDVDTSTINAASGTPVPKERAPRESLGVEDLNLPRTMIQRLAKGVLPPNTQIQKDALLALSKSATVFINFIAASASESAHGAGKKTIVPQDVYNALKDQEFESLLPRVQAEVAKYNETQSTKRNTYRRTKKAEQQGTTDVSGIDGDAMDITEAGDETMASVRTNGNDTDERPMKKIRREDGGEDVADGDDEDEPLEEELDEDSVDEDDVEEEDEEEAEEEQADEAEHEETTDGGFLNGIRDEALDEPDSD